jgi:hypothetical protein
VTAALGAARKAATRSVRQTATWPGVQGSSSVPLVRPEGRTGPCLNKDKWPRASNVRTRPAQLNPEQLRAKRLREAFPPGTVVPKHVRHCSALGATDWLVYTWRKDRPDVKTRAPYTCNSWRCPECKVHEAQITYARIQQATAPLSQDGFVFFVLTLDQRGYDRGEVAEVFREKHPEWFAPDGRWRNAECAYKALSAMTRNFLKRLRRFQSRNGWRVLKNEWVAVVEQHRTGWPHLNLVLWSPELAEELEHDRIDRESRIPLVLSVERRRAAKVNCRILRGELAELAQGTGWGARNTGEAARHSGGWASYITKLAGETGGEIAKITQAPTSAPVRFRRLRSGKGFLPPRYRDPNITGTLVRRTIWDGQSVVLPLHSARFATPAPYSQVEHIAACCYVEEELLLTERSAARWNRTARFAWPAASVVTPIVSRMHVPPARAAPS